MNARVFDPATAFTLPAGTYGPSAIYEPMSVNQLASLDLSGWAGDRMATANTAASNNILQDGLSSSYNDMRLNTGTGPGSGFNWTGVKDWLSNGQNLAAAVQGFQALSSAYLGYKQLSQAKEALNFQKTAFNTNLRNSTQNYNTSLEDRIRGRTSDYAGKEADVQSYLAKHRLKTP